MNGCLIDPIQLDGPAGDVMLALHGRHPGRYPILLESAAAGGPQGRYTLLLGAPGERLELDASGIRGPGEGATLNLPQPAGSGDREWLADFEGALAPALETFRPDVILVSAGFDAHRDDPLSATRLTEGAYRRMTEVLLDLARRHSHGRLVSVLEGGYDLGALASSAQAHVEALLGP